MKIDVTKNIYLESLTEKHVTDKYIEWLNDDEVMGFTEQNYKVHTFDTTIDFVRSMDRDINVFLFGIFFDEKHIGNIKLGPIDKNHSIADISYVIGDKDFWGKGFTTQIINKVCEFGFNVQNLEKICAGTYELNVGSSRVLEKNNFQREGILRNQVIHNKKRYDVFKYGLLKNEFKIMS